MFAFCQWDPALTLCDYDHHTSTTPTAGLRDLLIKSDPSSSQFRDSVFSNVEDVCYSYNEQTKEKVHTLLCPSVYQDQWVYNATKLLEHKYPFLDSQQLGSYYLPQCGNLKSLINVLRSTDAVTRKNKKEVSFKCGRADVADKLPSLTLNGDSYEYVSEFRGICI